MELYKFMWILTLYKVRWFWFKSKHSCWRHNWVEYFCFLTDFLVTVKNFETNFFALCSEKKISALLLIIVPVHLEGIEIKNFWLQQHGVAYLALCEKLAYLKKIWNKGILTWRQRMTVVILQAYPLWFLVGFWFVKFKTKDLHDYFTHKLKLSMWLNT